jgi:hypothetical protein
MSSFIFKYIQPGEENPENKAFSHGKSFWQSPLWSQILTKTHQAEVISAQNNDISLLIERRKIWGSYTGLYILGTSSDYVTEDFISALREFVSPHDLFLQIEPL